MKKNNRRLIEITILLSIAIISFLLWDTIILFPIKLFVVFLHEVSHAVAAIITGGSVIKMDVGLDLSGKCELTGGNTFVIASAGYLGSFLFGAFLFYSAYSKKYINLSIITITIIVVLFSVNLITTPIVQILSIIFSCGLLISMKYAPANFNKYLLIVLGLISCLYVVYDIKEDILSHTAVNSDASIIENITGIPALVWGFLWFSISLLGLFFLFKSAYKKA